MMDTALPAAAQDYPLLNVFWTMLWFSLWVLWLFLVFRVAIDIFRSRDLSGWGRAGWLLFVIVLPFLGVLTYLIARGDKMYGREARDMQSSIDLVSDEPTQAAGRHTGAANGKADELTKLAALHDRGVLTDAEFASQKATVLSA